MSDAFCRGFHRSRNHLQTWPLESSKFRRLAGLFPECEFSHWGVESHTGLEALFFEAVT